MYVVNCQDCEFSFVNDTTYDLGNMSLVAEQHEFETVDIKNEKPTHNVVRKRIRNEKAEEKLREDYDL